MKGLELLDIVLSKTVCFLLKERVKHEPITLSHPKIGLRKNLS